MKTLSNQTAIVCGVIIYIKIQKLAVKTLSLAEHVFTWTRTLIGICQMIGWRSIFKQTRENYSVNYNKKYNYKFVSNHMQSYKLPTTTLSLYDGMFGQVCLLVFINFFKAIFQLYRMITRLNG